MKMEWNTNRPGDPNPVSFLYFGSPDFDMFPFWVNCSDVFVHVSSLPKFPITHWTLANHNFFLSCIFEFLRIWFLHFRRMATSGALDLFFIGVAVGNMICIRCETAIAFLAAKICKSWIWCLNTLCPVTLIGISNRILRHTDKSVT